MNTIVVFRASLLTLLPRIARVGISVFALGMILSTLTPTLTAFASTHRFASRVQIDQNVPSGQFYPLSSTEVLVMDRDSNLLLEEGPFGTIPPPSRLIDTGVTSFQALSDGTILVLKGDQSLWLELGPFGTPRPRRVEIDSPVIAFQAVSPSVVIVQQRDTSLWFEPAPFGGTAAVRILIETRHVDAFQALSDTEVLVHTTENPGDSFNNGSLWLERAPFGNIPAPRTLIDTHVDARFHAFSDTQIVVYTVFNPEPRGTILSCCEQS
jgi:hypothetical protein